MNQTCCCWDVAADPQFGGGKYWLLAYGCNVGGMNGWEYGFGVWYAVGNAGGCAGV